MQHKEPMRHDVYSLSADGNEHLGCVFRLITDLVQKINYDVLMSVKVLLNLLLKGFSRKS